MKQVTMESVKQRIADLESAGKVVGGLSLSSEFELSCLRELVAVTEQRDALVVESSVIQNRMQQLVDIINKADNDYCMCGDAMKNHGHGGCGSQTGMFDYHYGRWSESAIETPATSAAIAALRAEGVEMLAERRKKAADIARQLDDLRIADSLEGEAIRAQMFAKELRESKGE